MPLQRLAPIAACGLLTLACARPALAQVAPPAPPSATAAPVADAPAANEPVIVPRVQRREIKPPVYPSRDFAVGPYLGTYATQNFGAATVVGLRLAYHLNEDFFAELTLGRSRVSDEAFRQVLPGGVFVDRTETLSYANASVGWNLLPGEVFFGRSSAKATQGYLVAGIGSTRFAGQRRQTFNAGFGLRLLLADWCAVQADVRDHVFSIDLLGKRQTTQNLEVTAGLGFFF